MLDQLVEALCVLVIERKEAAEQRVQQDAQTPHVSFGPDVLFPPNQFGRGIPCGETSHVCERLLSDSQHAGSIAETHAAEPQQVERRSDDKFAGLAMSPKSMSLMFECESSNKFSGFRSRCAIPCS